MYHHQVPLKPRDLEAAIMAAEAGGIALLSMYNDEEEDDDEQEPEAQAGAGGHADGDGGSKNNGVTPPPYPALEGSSPSLGARSPLFPDEGADYKTLKSLVARSPTPPPFRLYQQSSPFPLTSPSPPPPPLPTSFSDTVDAQRMKRGSLAIVDYAHDENAMSPEPEVILVRFLICLLISQDFEFFGGLRFLLQSYCSCLEDLAEVDGFFFLQMDLISSLQFFSCSGFIVLSIATS